MKVTELDVVETHEEFGINFYGKTIGIGNTAVHTCDGVNRDMISITQDGDSPDPDLIILFGREAVEGLRDTLNLHLELMDKEPRASAKQNNTRDWPWDKLDLRGSNE